MYSTPAILHASISAGRMGREALLMSVSPRQNFWKPPPVPEIPTVGVRLFGLALPNSSATASAMGNTVLDPSSVISETWVSPAAPSWAVLPPRQAARVNDTATAAAAD